MILIGKFSRVHGVKGLIKLISYCSKISSIKSYKNFYIDELTPIEINFVGKNKSNFICAVNQIKSREEIKQFEEKKVFIKKDDLPKLKEDEFYFFELENMQVELNKKIIGKILSVNNHGAGDYFEVKKKNGNVFCVPNNKEHVKLINLDDKIIFLNELYYTDEI